MGNYEGICRYCGTVDDRQRIAASQEEANNLFSMECECDGAELAEKRLRMNMNINELFRELASQHGLKKIPLPGVELIRVIGEMVLTGQINSAVVDAKGVKVNVSLGKEDVKLKRTETKCYQMEG